MLRAIACMQIRVDYERELGYPDGEQLAMTVSDGGSRHIWVQSAAAGDRRQVTSVAVGSSRPAWSPDGQTLAFFSSGLFLVDVASGSITPLTPEPGWMPAWSARGTIAFVTAESASPGVFAIGADGTNLRRISGDPGPSAVSIWSPDGRRLLVAAQGVHGASIAIVDPDSGTVTPILGDGMSASPAWQPRLP